MDIHVATFDAESDLAALEYAFDLEAVTGGGITAVHVVAPPERTHIPSAGSAATEGTVSRVATESDLEAVQAGERILNRSAARAEQWDLDIRTELLYGDPVPSLVGFAGDASLLVVERPTDEPAAEGTVTDELTDRAPVPVVVVPG